MRCNAFGLAGKKVQKALDRLIATEFGLDELANALKLYWGTLLTNFLVLML